MVPLALIVTLPADCTASTKRLFGCFVIRLGRNAHATTGLAWTDEKGGQAPQLIVPARSHRYNVLRSQSPLSSAHA